MGKVGRGRSKVSTGKPRLSTAPLSGEREQLVERIVQTLSIQSADCYGMNSSAFSLLTAKPKCRERSRENSMLWSCSAAPTGLELAWSDDGVTSGRRLVISYREIELRIESRPISAGVLSE